MGYLAYYFITGSVFLSSAKSVKFMVRLCFFLVLFLSLHLGIAQNKQDIPAYVEQYKDIAVREMVRCGIPASITLAQGIHESNCGKSVLSRNSNNHFGVKCKDEWAGNKYYHDDDAPQECFRVYEHAEASYVDHSEFLLTRPRYASLFELHPADYKNWAHGLKAAGYATNPKYASILIHLIEEHGLHEYDRIGLAEMRNKGKASNSPPASLTAQVKKEAPQELKQKEAADEKNVSFMGGTALEEPERNKHNTRKEMRVNGLRAIVANANEDPLKIALDYDLDLEQVMQFNDLYNGDRFKEGEYVYLEQKKSKATEKNYQIRAGESMRDVAQKFGMRLRDLYAKNLMKAHDQVRAGELVYMRDKRKTPPKTITYAQFLKEQNKTKASAAVKRKKIDNESAEYSVQPSDTLFSIARKFNMSVDELKALNNLDSVTIREGQRLVVSK